ncbi:hypothetical protein BaRGS_00007194 [Batillaria attramentaria]|uniref:Uncharacterized protein n=1 Tax=Batillaria attramentaria TaxID=370345 RepID=A0ABD0LRI5_9CAEN
MRVHQLPGTSGRRHLLTPAGSRDPPNLAGFGQHATRAARRHVPAKAKVAEGAETTTERGTEPIIGRAEFNASGEMICRGDQPEVPGDSTSTRTAATLSTARRAGGDNSASTSGQRGITERRRPDGDCMRSVCGRMWSSLCTVRHATRDGSVSNDLSVCTPFDCFLFLCARAARIVLC